MFLESSLRDQVLVPDTPFIPDSQVILLHEFVV